MPLRPPMLLPILLYHHVGMRREPGGHRRLWVSSQRFREHLTFLSDAGYRCLPLGACLGWLSGEAPPPRRTVALTFDDAYVNFRDHAHPVLREMGAGATVYVVTGEVGGTSRWDAGCETPLMDWSDLKRLHHEGVEFGAHSVTHPRLTALPAAQVCAELRHARTALEDRLGTPVRTVAYPYGDVNLAVGRAAGEAGYEAGCTILRGNLHRPAARMNLKRVQVDQYTTVERLRRRLAALYDITCRLHRTGRRARAALGLKP